jgi:hypothetical protein
MKTVTQWHAGSQLSELWQKSKSDFVMHLCIWLLFSVNFICMQIIILAVEAIICECLYNCNCRRVANVEKMGKEAFVHWNVTQQMDIYANSIAAVFFVFTFLCSLMLLLLLVFITRFALLSARCNWYSATVKVNWIFFILSWMNSSTMLINLLMLQW